MTWLSEDPWPLAGLFALLAVAFLIRLRFSQQGKHLAWAAGALGLAGMLLVIEQLWVTDRERIEMAVYDMADAVKASDFERFESHLAPEFEKQVGMLTKALLRGTLANVEFEFVRIAQLQIQAGRATRMGKADFLAQAQWEERSSSLGTDYNATPLPGIGFSVGFREVEPTIWQVTRIDVTTVPAGGTPENVAGYMARFSRTR
ncbi:hypothetical protein [Tautonia rosea]|uniref:hypothetical protein n=1 Tax=Tautonia rosea TaxID=2728037 RepID=UPI00147365D9|nr:hypothetical protein [Tautonia rosea]